MTAQAFTTTLNGKTYRLVLNEVCGRQTVHIRVLREKKDGTTEWAFLSLRQHKAEDTIRSRFAAQIAAHRASLA